MECGAYLAGTEERYNYRTYLPDVRHYKRYHNQVKKYPLQVQSELAGDNNKDKA